MFAGCSEISISVTVKHVQYIGVIGLFVYQGGNFGCLGRTEKKICWVVVCYTDQCPGWPNDFSQIILFSFVSSFMIWNLVLVEHCWRDTLKCPFWGCVNKCSFLIVKMKGLFWTYLIEEGGGGRYFLPLFWREK